MKRVVLIGLDPATVDFSDPALPPGMTAEKIHAGVKLALADLAARGWHAENCFIKPDETAVPTVERCLVDHVYDCVVIGAGLRLPPSRLVPATISRTGIWGHDRMTRHSEVKPPTTRLTLRNQKLVHKDVLDAGLPIRNALLSVIAQYRFESFAIRPYAIGPPIFPE